MKYHYIIVSFEGQIKYDSRNDTGEEEFQGFESSQEAMAAGDYAIKKMKIDPTLHYVEVITCVNKVA